MKSRSTATVVAVVLAIVYAWFATGVKPFHAVAYVVLALPILVVVGLYTFMNAFADERSELSHGDRERSLPMSLSRSAPWLLVLIGAIILETVGLILGGRSSRVPTLSTMVDHVLTTHGLRCALFLLWLVVGVAPLRRLSEQRGRVSE
jgi:hypothetical protein